ncbi:MAG: hypothetical protein KDA28_11020 [Phycisphaerales bacterium]|nr:hypothetical protein [Phycisphaerales bacterium]
MATIRDETGRRLPLAMLLFAATQEQFFANVYRDAYLSQDQCPSCRYDLRGSTGECPSCPECGGVWRRVSLTLDASSTLRWFGWMSLVWLVVVGLLLMAEAVPFAVSFLSVYLFVAWMTIRSHRRLQQRLAQTMATAEAGSTS